MFDDVIEAWDYGPVVPSIYQKYKSFGRNILDTDNPDLLSLPTGVKDIVDGVIEDKGRYTGIALMHMTHKDIAWKKAFKSQDRIISADLIRQNINI